MQISERRAASGKYQIDSPPRLISSRCGNDLTSAGHSGQISIGAPSLTLKKQGAKMTQEISVQEQNKHELSIIEQVVLQGDLSKLNPEQRVVYYNKVCESVGLNPFTRPFDYIQLNGKLTLYAKKDCTEQLRKLNGISIEGLEDKMVDDVYIVTAMARDKHGRIDQAKGAVTLGGLRGDAKANAIMKAETKAKRRVTLSISGLGWVDETEIETIPAAKTVHVDMSTGEIQDMGEIQVKPIQAKALITQEQADELKMLLDECSEDYKKYAMGLVKHHFNSDFLTGVHADQYEKLKAAAIREMEAEYAKQRSESECAEMAVGVQ